MREKEREEGGKETPPTPNPRITTEEELKTYPWIRPSIKGITTIMEDKPHTGGKLRIVENRKVDVRTMTNEKGQQVAAPIIKKVNQIVKAKEAKMAKRDDEKRRMRDKPKNDKGKEAGKENSKQRDPNWNMMELVSSQTEEESKRIAEAVEFLRRKGLSIHIGVGDRNMPPPR